MTDQARALYKEIKKDKKSCFHVPWIFFYNGDEIAEDGALFEVFDRANRPPSGHKYRVIFSPDDYDYVEDEKLIKELDKEVFNNKFFRKCYVTGMSSDIAGFFHNDLTEKQKLDFIKCVDEVCDLSDQKEYLKEYPNFLDL